MNSNKLYLPIKNARLNNVLYNKLEEICNDENIQIVEEQASINWFDPKPSIYSEYSLSSTRDVLLCGYNEQKLQYIGYLYEQYEKRFRHAGQFITNVIEEKNKKYNGEIKVIVKDSLDCLGYALEPTKISTHIHQSCNFKDKDYWSILGWKHVNLQVNKKHEPFREKLCKFYNKHRTNILSFTLGCLCITIWYMILLTIKHFMVG